MVESRKGWIIFMLCAINGVYLYSKYRAGDLNILGFNVADFHIPKMICFAPAALITPVEELLFSTFIIVCICAACHYARRMIDVHVADPFIKQLLFEATAAADLCGCCSELIIVADNFGLFTYCVYLFSLTVWWSKMWGDATACPYTHLEDVMQGRQEIQPALMKIWAELTGGVMITRLALFIWSFEAVGTHEHMAEEQCTADLKVALLYGIIIEAAGTFFSQVVEKTIIDMKMKNGEFLSSFLLTAAVAAGFDLTGGYYNPVLASSIKFGCQGNTLFEHMAVYWVGSCLGSVLSVYAYDRTGLVEWARRQRRIEDEEHEKDE